MSNYFDGCEFCGVGGGSGGGNGWSVVTGGGVHRSYDDLTF